VTTSPFLLRLRMSALTSSHSHRPRIMHGDCFSSKPKGSQSLSTITFRSLCCRHRITQAGRPAYSVIVGGLGDGIYRLKALLGW
jgi:hypothetical protein